MRKFMGENTKAPKTDSKKVQAVVAAEGSKSGKIKELFDMGLEVKEIAALLEIRYNFAYNVISNYVNINDIQVVNEARTGGKKDEIVRLYQEGAKKTDIAKALKTNINYIYKVLKDWEAEQTVVAEVAAELEGGAK